MAFGIVYKEEGIELLKLESSRSFWWEICPEKSRMFARVIWSWHRVSHPHHAASAITVDDIDQSSLDLQANTWGKEITFNFHTSKKEERRYFLFIYFFNKRRKKNIFNWDVHVRTKVFVRSFNFGSIWTYIILYRINYILNFIV